MVPLLIPVLFFSACAGQPQPVVSASQPTPTDPQALESVGTPTATFTPLPASTATNASPTPKPQSRTPTPGQSFLEVDLVRADSPGQALTDEEYLLLPDLVTLPPTDLRIRVNPADGHKILRFTNSIINIGPGKIELWGDNKSGTGKVTVTQYIYTIEDSIENVDVGEFFFHPEHDHWHLGNFARYDVLSFSPDGDFDTVVATSNKISYCLRDDARSDIPDASVRQSYTSCDLERQGISIGWIDIYRHYLPGQSIDVTFLPDGIYALRSTVDPEDSLWESSRANNTAILHFEIVGNKVNIVELPANFNRLLHLQE